MKENLFTKGFEKSISGEKIAATEIKKFVLPKAGFLFNGRQKAEIHVTSARAETRKYSALMKLTLLYLFTIIAAVNSLLYLL